ncbi:MAG: sodium-dependent transporter [Chlamydiia bacterium]|nr:sodium-dependent transporter [Chlamydiia bacterium]
MKEKREHWSSVLGFVLAAAGSAIGLGTLWKFPYVMGQNGGGLFVLVYVLCTLFVGVPIFVGELLLGRKAQRGAVGIFMTLAPGMPFWKVIGWLGVLSSFFIMAFYSVIAGWGMNYALMCLNQFYEGRSAEEIRSTFDLLRSSGDITLFWHALFTGLSMAVVYRGVQQGIEYWSRWMTTTLLVLMLGLSCYAMTLDGVGEAVRFVFHPNFETFRPSSVLDALGLSLFTLSLGQGIMLTYGSYMGRNEDIPQTAGVIATMILIVSLFAAMLIFPIIFTFGLSPEQGVGLVFQTLPLLFERLKGSLVISTLFFVLFVFTALTSAMAFLEVIAANLIDLFDWSRKKAVLSGGIACFIMGIPAALAGTGLLFANWQAIYGKNFFDTLNDLVSVWLLPLGGLLLSLYIGWFSNLKALKGEFTEGTRVAWLFSPWLFFIRWITPIMILLMLLQKGGFINFNESFALLH